MTFFAFLAFLASVHVILLVTSEAVLGKILLVKDTFVARSAFDCPMFSVQRKFCVPMVIEDRTLPVFRCMTGPTFGAESSLVAPFPIIGFVACVTVFWCAFVAFICVATLTLHKTVFTC